MRGGDPGGGVRVGLDLAGVAAQPHPHPAARGGESGEQHDGDRPVGERMQPVRVERGGGVAGPEQHPDPGRRPGRRLVGAGEERGDATGGAQDEREAEQADQSDHGGVGQLVAEAAGLPSLRRHAHRRVSTTMEPELRPTNTTSSAPEPTNRAGSSRARAVPSPVASVWETMTATATSSPGTNPSPVTSTSTGRPGVRFSFFCGTGSAAAGLRGAAGMRSVKLVPSASCTSTRTGTARSSLAWSMICGNIFRDHAPVFSGGGCGAPLIVTVIDPSGWTSRTTDRNDTGADAAGVGLVGFFLMPARCAPPVPRRTRMFTRTVRASDRPSGILTNRQPQ